MRQRFFFFFLPPLRGVREGRAHQQTLPSFGVHYLQRQKRRGSPPSFFSRLNIERDESERVQSTRDIFLHSLLSAGRPPLSRIKFVFQTVMIQPPGLSLIIYSHPPSTGISGRCCFFL